MTTALEPSASAWNSEADEKQLRERLQAWAHGVRTHDLDAVTRHHAEDIVYFDVPLPTQVQGIEAYRASWPPFFSYIGTTGQFDLEELSVNAGAEVAFAHGILVVRGEAETAAQRVRLSVGFRKIDAEWTVTHEHHSAPYQQRASGDGQVASARGLKKVAFTMYPVTDVARARRFYEETLGLTVGMAGGRGEMYWVEYDLPGGGCFAITNTTGEAPSASAGGTVALEVEDLEQLMAHLKEREVSFKSAVIQGPRCRMAVCLDSEGNSILLHQLSPKGERA